MGFLSRRRRRSAARMTRRPCRNRSKPRRQTAPLEHRIEQARTSRIRQRSSPADEMEPRFSCRGAGEKPSARSAMALTHRQAASVKGARVNRAP